MNGPTKTNGDVADIWFARPSDMDRGGDEERFLSLLDATEQTRWNRLRFAVDRRAFLAAHAMLRLCLSEYADVRPADWTFESNGDGRPEIRGNRGDSPLRFNLSHSRELVACVITAGLDCGIDVEAVGRVKDPMSIAGRYFAPSEIRQLESLAGRERDGRFTELWTLKEAALKGIGKGLGEPLDSVFFDIGPGRTVRGRWARSRAEEPGRWRYLLDSPTPGHVLAAAVRSPSAQEVDFRRHRLDFSSLESTPFRDRR